MSPRPVVRDTRPLEQEVQNQLAVAAQGGDRGAMDRLVASNMAWIWRQAKRFRGVLDPEDALQEGVLGFMHAVGKFEPGRSTIQTYSQLWIRSYVQAAAARTGVVKVWSSSNLRGARAAIYRLAEERGCTPVELLGDADAIGCVAERCGVTEETVQRLVAGFGGKISTDFATHSPRAAAPQEHQPDAQEEAAERERTDLVWRALELLAVEDPRAARILSRQLDDPPTTLEALGEELELSRERVRQIELRARPRFRELYLALAGETEAVQPARAASPSRRVARTTPPPPLATEDPIPFSKPVAPVPRDWELGVPFASHATYIDVRSL